MGQNFHIRLFTHSHRLVHVRLKGVRATGDWAGAMWLQQYSESHFFGTPSIRLFKGQTYNAVVSQILKKMIGGLPSLVGTPTLQILALPPS